MVIHTRHSVVLQTSLSVVLHTSLPVELHTSLTVGILVKEGPILLHYDSPLHVVTPISCLTPRNITRGREQEGYGAAIARNIT